MIKHIDVIVPCYNEESSLDRFWKESGEAFSAIEGYEFRYIFIDDGSSDETLQKIRRLQRQMRPMLRVLTRSSEQPVIRLPEILEHARRFPTFPSAGTSARKPPCMPDCRHLTETLQ